MKKANSTKLLITALILMVFSLTVLLGACSAASPVNKDEGSYQEQAPLTTTTMAAGGGSGQIPDMQTDQINQAQRKIIRNASLDLTVVDVLTTYDEILSYAVSLGGYETQRQQTDNDDYTVIKAQIKLPPEHLDALVDFVRESGNLINCQISSEDITSSYYDTQIRLESMEKTLDKYYEYLADSRNIEETLSVQNQINTLTMEIESLKGKLKLWDSLLSESTVDVYIRQVNDPVLIKKEVNWSALSWDDMKYLMTSGLKYVVNVLAGIGQWLLIIAIAGAPLWIPALIIVIIAIRISRKRRKKVGLQIPVFEPNDRQPQEPADNQDLSSKQD